MSDIAGRQFTEAQLRAFRLLDGAWQTKFGRDSAAVSSLVMYHADLAESNWGNHGARGGYMLAYRLTPGGVDFKNGPLKDQLK